MDLIPTFWDAALRILAATMAGGLLGWERETKGRPAGMRTHMLVSLGATTAMVITLRLCGRFEENGLPPIDPSRVIQGIIGGIGFLGAGSIIQSRGSVKGLTTAASIWLAGAVGIAAGLAEYAIVAVVVAAAFVILSALIHVEKAMDTKPNDQDPEPTQRSKKVSGQSDTPQTTS